MLAYLGEDIVDGVERIYHHFAEKPQKRFDPNYDSFRRGQVPPKVMRSWEKHGLIFGKLHRQYICRREEDDGHPIIIGPPGAMKSRVLMEWLRNWRAGFFALDIKNELYEAVKNVRENVKLINPEDPQSDGYNPFYVLRETDHIATPIKALAHILIPRPNRSSESPVFIDNARLLLEAAMIYYYRKYNRSFIDVMDIVLMTDKEQLVEDLKNSGMYDVAIKTTEIYNTAKQHPELFSSFPSTMVENLELYGTDKMVRQFLSKKKVFHPALLEEGVDACFGVKESKLDVWSPLYSLVTAQNIKYYEDRALNGVRPLLFLVEEVARLHNPKEIIGSMGTLRGRKITIAPVIQNMAQIDDKIGVAARQAMFGNASYVLMLGATDTTTQKTFCEMIGKCKRTKTSRTFSNGSSSTAAAQINESEEWDWVYQPSEFSDMSVSEKRTRKGWKHWRDREYVILKSPFGYHQLEKKAFLGRIDS